MERVIKIIVGIVLAVVLFLVLFPVLGVGYFGILLLVFFLIIKNWDSEKY